MEKEELYKARSEVRDWLFRYGETMKIRDSKFVAARLVGLSVTEIADLTGMSRQQISRIINGPGRAFPPAGADSSNTEG